jgi:tRNA(Arg) A34 adenosine deaminase TadA
MPADPGQPDGPRKDLTKTVLVSTAEPCPMCATCAIFSGVMGVAYGTSVEFLMAHPPTRHPIRMSMPQVVAAGPRPDLPVVGGVLREQTDQLFMPAHRGVL